jgi:hypothetical protein
MGALVRLVSRLVCAVYGGSWTRTHYPCRPLLITSVWRQAFEPNDPVVSYHVYDDR